MTAAFEAPYAKRLGSPLIEPAIEAMLMMLTPRPDVWYSSSILGSAARIATYIARTLRLKLNSQSFGAQSRIVPLCTYPAQLNRIDSGGGPSRVRPTPPPSSPPSAPL